MERGPLPPHQVVVERGQVIDDEGCRVDILDEEGGLSGVDGGVAAAGERARPRDLEEDGGPEPLPPR